MSEALETIDEEALRDGLVRLAAELNARMSRWLPLVGEFDRRRSCRRYGFRSTAEWLAWHCAISPRAAREHVRVARRLRQMPAVTAAFAAGDLSYSKIRALTRAAEHHPEAELLAMAQDRSAGELEHEVRSLRSSPSADVAVASVGHAMRRLDWWWEHDGTLRFSGRLSPDDGAAFIEAVETAAAALHGGPNGTAVPPDPSAEPPSVAAQRADALAEIALSGCPRTQVVLHVDTAALACTATAAQEREGEVCAIEGGPAVPSETARRMACDGEVVEVRPGFDGVPDHGRRRRVVSPAMRTALERRDGHCRFPGCRRRHGLHAHHLLHWAHGGRTDRENLVLLCRFHHRLVHEEGFHAQRREGRLVFCDPAGEVIAERPPRLPDAVELALTGPQPPPRGLAA